MCRCGCGCMWVGVLASLYGGQQLFLESMFSSIIQPGNNSCESEKMDKVWFNSWLN